MDEYAVERVFRALVRGPSVAMAVRDPHTLTEIAGIAELDVETVKQIVVEFSAEDNLFLRVDEPVTAESYVDLNHESLIRQWSLLSEWVRKEAESAEIWQSLARGAAAWKKAGEPEDDLPSGPGLARRLAWWAGETPNPAWAARYCDPQTITVDEVGGYLEKAKLVEELRQKETERQRQWGRITVGVIGALVVVLAFSFALYWQMSESNAATRKQNKRLDRLVSALTVSKLATEENGKKLAAAVARSNHNYALAVRNAKEAQAQAVLAQQNAIKAVQARQFAAQRIADAANTATLAVLQDNFADVGLQQQSADVSMSDVRRRYLKLQEHLNAMSGGGPERARLLAKVETELATGEGREITPDSQSAAAIVDGMRNRAQNARRLSSDPVTLAGAALVEAAAHQIMMEYPAATDKYKQVLAALDHVPGDEAAFMATQANASLAGLAWATGAPDQSEQFLGACARSSERLSPDPQARERIIPWVLECDRLGAEIEIDRQNYTKAGAILKAIRTGVPPDQVLTVPEIGVLIRAALAASRVPDHEHFLINDRSFVAAKRFYETHGDTEEASDLYADGLYLTGQYVDAFETRTPFLSVKGTSLAYLASSERLIRASLPQLDLESPAGLLSGLDFDSGGTLPAAISDDVGKRLTRILYFALTASVLHRLNQAGVARLPNLSSSPDETDRNALIQSLAERSRLTAASVSETIEAVANGNQLLADLRRSPKVMVSPADEARSQAVADLMNDYQQACGFQGDEWDGPQVAAMAQECQRGAEGLNQRLLPVLQLAARVRNNETVVLYDSSKYWLGGLDPVPFHTNSRLARGQTDLAIEWLGRSFLFASETNLDQFRKNPSTYLPDFGGNAPNWLQIGEVVEGNPWIYCLSENRLFVFEKSDDRQGWCSEGRPTKETLARIDQARLNWDRIKVNPATTGAQFVVSPLGDVASRDLGPWRFFIAPPHAEVRAPAGGRLIPGIGSSLVIEHPGGLRSEFGSVVSDYASQQMVSAGDVIGHVLNRNEGTVPVRWGIYKIGQGGTSRIPVQSVMPR